MGECGERDSGSLFVGKSMDEHLLILSLSQKKSGLHGTVNPSSPQAVLCIPKTPFTDKSNEER
jgi:hypothetical protein